MKITDIIYHDNFQLLIFGILAGLAAMLYYKIGQVMDDFQQTNRENLAHIMAVNTLVAAEVLSIDQYNEIFEMYHNALVSAEEEE